MGNNKRVLKAIDRELKDRYRSKRYSKSLSATNSLFAPNYLFSKPSKRRIYNPNAKYFEHGGVHGNVNPIEGNLYSKVLMNRNRGVDFVDRAFALGDNPGTPLFNVPDDEQFGSYMSHKMAYGSDDIGQTWMYPTIFNDADEAIKVPNQYADYISSEGYKNATGMVRKNKAGGYVLEEMHEGGYPHSHPHEDEVTITGSRKSPSNLSLEQRQQAYDDSTALYNLGIMNKAEAKNLAIVIEGESDYAEIAGRMSDFEGDKACRTVDCHEKQARLRRLNGFIKGDLREEKAPTTGDLYETIRWQEYSDYKPKGKRPKTSIDANDPYEFGLDINERLGQAFDKMNNDPDRESTIYTYSNFYRDNYNAGSDKYKLDGSQQNDPFMKLSSGVLDYDEEQLKSYINLYKEFVDGYQNDIDKGEEKDYTKKYLKSYKDIVSTLEEVLDSPIKPKSVIYNPELAPLYIYDKPTYRQAYKNVDKDKYPTYEDFKFAADYYNETGTNPDFQDLPSNRLGPPPEPEYEVNDIEPEIEIDRLPIVKSKLNLDTSLPEELQGVDYVLDKKGNISGFIKADPGKTGNRKRNYRKLKRDKKERALDGLNEGLQYKSGGNVSWDFKGKSYSGTLIPGMETENNRYARTHNGKIKTLPKRKHGGPHDPPNYEDAMQAYKDSIAAKEAYEEEYKKKEKDYSKLKAKYDRYNKAYLNNKKMWELIDSIDPESNPYVNIDQFPSFNQGLNAYKLYQNLPSDIKEQLGFPEFDKRDIGQRFNTSVTPAGNNNSYFDEDAGSAELIDLYHLHNHDLTFRYPKDDPEYKPDHAHLAYPTVTNWNHRFYPQDHAKGLYVEENFPIASVYDVHSDPFKNITDKDVKVINFFGDRNSDLDFYNRQILKLLRDSGLDLTGMNTDTSQSEKQIIDRLIKLQEPDKIGSLEYNPPEVLERPNFADYVDPMPVIKPKLIVDASLPEELEEGDEVEGIDYEIKRGPYIQPGSGFLELQKGLVGTAGRTGRRLRYKGPRLKFGKRIVPIENELEYPEGFVPKFQHGGPHDPPKENAETQRDWMINYIQSPMYLKRLSKEFPDYSDKQLESERNARLSNVKNVNIKYPRKSIDQRGYGYIAGAYYAKKNKSTNFDRRATTGKLVKPIIEPEKSGNLYLEPEYRSDVWDPYEGYNTIPLHEIGHAADDGGFRIPDKTEKLIYDSTNKAYAGEYPNYDINPWDYATKEINQLPFTYKNTPTEFVNRLIPLRYELERAGIWKPGEEDFQLHMYNKMMKNPDVMKNEHIKDVLESIPGGDETIDKRTTVIKLLNEIALNDVEQDLNVAKYGGSHGDDELITYKNNKDLIDGTANWDMQSDVEISSDYNDQIKSRLLTGNYGYNPKTGELVKLDKSQRTKVTDPYAIESRKDLKAMQDMTQDEAFDYQRYKRDNEKWESHKKYIEGKAPVLIDRADAWRPHFQLTDESGNTFDAYDRPGEEVFMTPAQKKSYLKAMVSKNAPIAQQQMNNAFRAAASFTPAGMALNAIEGAVRLGMDVPKLIKDPSWSTAGAVAGDLLMAAPFIPAAASKTGQVISKVDDALMNAPRAQMTLNSGVNPNMLVNAYQDASNVVKNVVKNTYKLNPRALKSLADKTNQSIATPHWLKGYPKVLKYLPKGRARELLLKNKIPYGKNYPKGDLMDDELYRLYKHIKGTGSPRKYDIQTYTDYNEWDRGVRLFKDKSNPSVGRKRLYGEEAEGFNYSHMKPKNAFGKQHREEVNRMLYGNSDLTPMDKFSRGFFGAALGSGAGVTSYVAGMFLDPVYQNAINRKLNYPLYPTSRNANKNISTQDTLINLNDNDLTFGQVKDRPEGRILLGGDFIDERDNTVRTSAQWLKDKNGTYGDDYLPIKSINNFYGVEDGKFKVGTPKDFKSNTKIVPNRYSKGDYLTKAVLSGGDSGYLRLFDKDNNPIYHNSELGGKIILHSKDSGESIFLSHSGDKKAVDQINNFVKNNKNVMPVIIDNGRYVDYMIDESGLKDYDYMDYYSNDFERGKNAGYNIILKQEGGAVELGDEVDEATMQRLKEQGYIFEEI